MLEKIRDHEIPRKKERHMRAALQDYDFLEVDTSFRGGSHFRKANRAVMAWSWAAGLIDSLVVFSMVCVFLLTALLMVRMDAGSASISKENFVIAGSALFSFLSMAYLLSLRIFLGHSLGEWACGLRLGEPRQRYLPGYSLKVVFRFAVVMATGLIVLTILSLITGKDWAGKLSGLPLVGISTQKSS